MKRFLQWLVGAVRLSREETADVLMAIRKDLDHEMMMVISRMETLNVSDWIDAPNLMEYERVERLYSVYKKISGVNYPREELLGPLSISERSKWVWKQLRKEPRTPGGLPNPKWIAPR